MSITVVVPTFNEGPNVAELVRRLDEALEGTPGASVLFVDDSRDDTPSVIERVAAEQAASGGVPVRMIHREVADGGLSGAVVEGLRAVGTEWAVVMDGDLQHPPELATVLATRGREAGLDVVVASRYIGGGDAGGLDGHWRRAVSTVSALLARSMFPLRLRNVTDPLTGFFAVRLGALDLDALRPRGFKILLEILARGKRALAVGEEPFVFGERHGGSSKATLRMGLRYLEQLASLRFGRMSRFAIIGGMGAVWNVLILWALTVLGMHYLGAAVIAAAVTISVNFALQERFVFRDLLGQGRFGFWSRLAHSVTFNGTEAVVRTAVLGLIVELSGFWAVPVQGALLAVAFLLRFVFHSQWVYRPRRTAPPRLGDALPTPPGHGVLGAASTDERVQ
ncbi:glycosyltransferase [Myceligenerans pegani]|uniref:Glycosyltransferase n=1 Tax=Myceligenerans pegani TaxID=2776917 RepID=A0ABR9MTC6_9MICO|nr:glycosyltransferase [Myceligenerans sp. TRM 65318]MBE1874640.1 glycosyltransferase [Myceligenerans sp. TRM 65318]MBE3016911.1 glycosyltransferase [Myceligenerans sp. TRM 65318]